MGKPLVRFWEGQEFNCDMEEILWHRRESRRKQRKQTSSLSYGRLPATRNQPKTPFRVFLSRSDRRNAKSNRGCTKPPII
jgi:hypothetical protein